MTDRILLAARNNALWCDAVARSHGVRCTVDADAWTAQTRTPPFYPDAVTLSPAVGEYDVLARVDDSDGCSVKDSWSRLDLSAEDFARIVVGEWVWLEATASLSTPAGPDWRPVTSAAAFDDWVQAWATDPDAVPILRPSLLDAAGVHVLAAHASAATDAPLVAGAVVNLSGGVAGLGNVFALDGKLERAWAGAVTAARELVGPVPFVGWDAGAGLDAAVAACFEPVGPLSVWLK